MDPGKFEFIKRNLAIGVVDTLMRSKGWSEDEAVCRFMSSEVYEALRNEETKVWHFSVSQLSLMFDDELEGQLAWPEQP